MHTRTSFNSKKEGNLAVWDNINETWGHYAKWSKSDRKRAISYDFTYMWNLKKQPQSSERERTDWRSPEVRDGAVNELG